MRALLRSFYSVKLIPQVCAFDGFNHWCRVERRMRNVALCVVDLIYFFEHDLNIYIRNAHTRRMNQFIFNFSFTNNFLLYRVLPHQNSTKSYIE